MIIIVPLAHRTAKLKRYIIIILHKNRCIQERIPRIGLSSWMNFLFSNYDNHD